jgi:DNA-binding SARP family transcriptional activator
MPLEGPQVQAHLVREVIAARALPSRDACVPDPAVASPLTLRLLGPLEAYSGDECLSQFRHDRVRALLGLLAEARGAFYSRRALADLLWPNSSPRMSSRSLRNALTDLRRALRQPETHAIQSSASEVALRVMACNIESDIESFWDDPRRGDLSGRIHQLRRTLSLYRGPFLESLEVVDSQPFSDWLARTRAHYQQRVIELHHEIIACHVQAGNLEEALLSAGRCLELDATVEKSHRLMMMVLRDLGRNSAAIEQYHRCMAMVDEEFACQPEPETQALYRSMVDVAQQVGPGDAFERLPVVGATKCSATVVCVREVRRGRAPDPAIARAVVSGLQLRGAHVLASGAGLIVAVFHQVRTLGNEPQGWNQFWNVDAADYRRRLSAGVGLAEVFADPVSGSTDLGGPALSRIFDCAVRATAGQYISLAGMSATVKDAIGKGLIVPLPPTPPFCQRPVLRSAQSLTPDKTALPPAKKPGRMATLIQPSPIVA